jgi:hypothetical protein
MQTREMKIIKLNALKNLAKRMITHFKVKSIHEFQNTPLDSTKLQHKKHGFFQLSLPIYHKNTNIFKKSNINTKMMSSKAIFCLKTRIK